MKTSKLQNLAKAKIELIKKAAWDDFYVFAKYVCGRELMEEQPHRELCEFLTAGLDKSKQLNLKFTPPLSAEYVIKECKHKLKKLVQLPRGSFKSTVATNAFPVWLMWHNQDLRLMIDSETLGNAKLYLAGIKDMIENSEMLKQICVNERGEYLLEPNRSIAGGFTEEQIILKHRKKVGLKEPTVFCSGVDNARTGMHPDIIIMDDLVSERNVGTETQISKTKDHYRYSLSLLEPDGLQLVIGTRYHMADLYGDLIDSDTFDILIRPAIDSKGNLYFPTRLTTDFLNEQKKSQGSYIFSCNPKGAPVLMADWTFKDISEIKVGDMVLGFTLGNSKCKSKFVPSKVTACGNKKANVSKIIFENGTEIRCTPDHNWYTGRRPSEKEPHRKLYKPAQIGGSLLNITQVWRNVVSQEEKIDYAYLSAMIDGEGAVKYGSISISQDYNIHPKVCERIMQTLKNLKIPYKEYITQGTQRHYVINGGRDEKIRILNQKMLGKSDDLVNNLFDHSSASASSKDKIVDIVDDGEDTVYSFQTETGNYVVWGYMSKNCQYMLNPVDDSNSVFKRNHIKYWDNHPKDIVTKYIMIDLAISQKETADYFVCMCVGVTSEKKIYVLDYDRKRCLPKDQINSIFAMYEKHNKDGKLKAVGIETVAYQKAMVYFIKDEMKRRGIYMPLKELKADKDKFRRIQALQPLFESGDVYMHISHRDLELELLEFPVGKHDDMIDALAYVLQLLRTGNIQVTAKKYEYQPTNAWTNY